MAKECDKIFCDKIFIVMLHPEAVIAGMFGLFIVSVFTLFAFPALNKRVDAVLGGYGTSLRLGAYEGRRGEFTWCCSRLLSYSPSSRRTYTFGCRT